MTIPGFHAEASVYRGTDLYRTGPPASAGTSDRIAPAWYRPTCADTYSKCSWKCSFVFLGPDLTEYDDCIRDCDNAFAACTDPPDRSRR
ncbi:hypothetical protein [Kitasatospora sp. NPDC057015]|uniref:hypothetical protein n=1 Tax=Kitasatospora sp. NPDC057015 TaxID=3346001 RepID=UPI0036451A99